MKKAIIFLLAIFVSSVMANEGSMLYKKCIVCHGKKAEKKAFNKSQIIAKWDAKQIQEALQGYKNKTYGGALKATMIGQVKTLSDEDIKTLAKYIQTLQ
jgi:cytochrome c553